MNAHESISVIKDIAQGLRTLVNDNKARELANTASGKKERTYNQREAMAATGGTHSQQLNDICKELGVEPKVDGKWRVPLSVIQDVRAHLGHVPFTRKEDHPLAIFCISTLKGGSGKTTDTATIAVGVATEPMTQYRVGVIDLDPQATLTTLIKPNFDDEEDMSIGDLLMGNYELDEGETFEQVCRDSFLETNVPNLRILPARDYDRKYESDVKLKEIEANKTGEAYSSLFDVKNIIEAVKDDFDILFIDTAPQFSAATLTGHYAANSLIIPIRPSENDRDASSKYMDFLADMYEILVGLDHKGYNDINVLLSAVRLGSPAQVKLAKEIRDEIDEHCYEENFFESDAVVNSAKRYSTVFDISASTYATEKIGSRESMKRAQEGYSKIVTEVESKVLNLWGLNNNG